MDWVYLGDVDRIWVDFVRFIGSMLERLNGYREWPAAWVIELIWVELVGFRVRSIINWGVLICSFVCVCSLGNGLVDLGAILAITMEIP